MPPRSIAAAGDFGDLGHSSNTIGQSSELAHNPGHLIPVRALRPRDIRHSERLGFHDLGSHHGPMPQRVRMFLEGLARQPGDAISMVATPVGRLV